MSNVLIETLLDRWQDLETKESYYFLFEKPCGYQQLILIPKYYKLLQMYHRVLNNLTGLIDFNQKNIRVCFSVANFISNSSSFSFVNSGGGGGRGEENEENEEDFQAMDIEEKKEQEEQEYDAEINEINLPTNKYSYKREEKTKKFTCKCGNSHLAHEKDDVFQSEILTNGNADMMIHEFIKKYELKPIFDVNSFPFAVYLIYFDYIN